MASQGRCPPPRGHRAGTDGCRAPKSPGKAGTSPDVGLPPRGNRVQQAAIRNASLFPPSSVFSRLYFWKEAREGVMIFKKHPLPKKGYSLHIQRFAPQTGRLGCQAASHPGSAEQGFLPRFPSSLLPGAVTQISTLLSARFLEHRAHLELLKPKYPPPRLPHPQSQILPELKQAQSQEGVPGRADSLLHFSLISGELE